ncbi:ABC transporter ATP-binding protein [Puniceicoccaceae bacterium K14]|nr:ABC transporter ATP-binding protein [Puniceicoccaceae bacterium K14]
MDIAIEVKNLRKDFVLARQSQRLRAVDDLSFQVNTGSVFGLLGPNGSGKSTTIKAILGMLNPDKGECLIEGISSKKRESRARIGYLPEGPYYYKFMEGLEFVSLVGQLGGLTKLESVSRGEELMDLVGLQDACDRRISGYSKGMLQRLGLAQALVNDPSILILDEPTAGVDPVGAVDIANIIGGLKNRGKTILLCSHLLSQVETVCDEVAVLNKGNLVASGKIDELLVAGNEYMEIPECSLEATQRIEAILSEEGQSLVKRRDRKSLEQLFIELTQEEE